MFSVWRASSRTSILSNSRRWLATEVALPNVVSKEFAKEVAIRGQQDLLDPEPEISEAEQKERYEAFLEEKAKEGPLRPHFGVEVDPNHGLWAFFRKIDKDGVESYETIERDEPGVTMGSGRSWNAFELRRKSFKDLHTLWYIVLRERNLLATQRAEALRLHIRLDLTTVLVKDRQCRKTMARIKQILNERRLAYEQAVAFRYQETAPPVEPAEEQKPPNDRRGRRRRQLNPVAVFRANSVEVAESASESQRPDVNPIQDTPSTVPVEAKA